MVVIRTRARVPTQGKGRVHRIDELREDSSLSNMQSASDYISLTGCETSRTVSEDHSGWSRILGAKGMVTCGSLVMSGRRWVVLLQPFLRYRHKSLSDLWLIGAGNSTMNGVRWR
jgi:hypothetical protein